MPQLVPVNPLRQTHRKPLPDVNRHRPPFRHGLARQASELVIP